MEKEGQPRRIMPAEVIREDVALQQALGLDVRPEFRVGFKIPIFNVEMRRRREESGLTQHQLSQRLQERGIKCGLQTAGQVEQFRFLPKGELAEAIAEELGTTEEVLFPEWLRYCVTKRATVVLEEPVTPEMIKSLQGQPHLLALPAPEETDLEAIVSQKELEEKFEAILSTLPPRERELIRLRFWDDLTLEEIGEEFGVTRGRVRQIEGKALRKLRQPVNTKEIRDFAG